MRALLRPCWPGGPLVARAGASHSSPSAREFAATVATAWSDLERDSSAYSGLQPAGRLTRARLHGPHALRGDRPRPGRRPVAGGRAGSATRPRARNAAYDWRLVANAALAEILRQLFPTAPFAGRSSTRSRRRSRTKYRRGRRSPSATARSSAAGRSPTRSSSGRERRRARGLHAQLPGLHAADGAGLWVPTPPPSRRRCSRTGARTAASPSASGAMPAGRAPAVLRNNGLGASTPRGSRSSRPPTADARAGGDRPLLVRRSGRDGDAGGPLDVDRDHRSAPRGREPRDRGGDVREARHRRRGRVHRVLAAKFAFNLLRPVTYVRERVRLDWRRCSSRRRSRSIPRGTRCSPAPRPPC